MLRRTGFKRKSYQEIMAKRLAKKKCQSEIKLPTEFSKKFFKKIDRELGKLRKPKVKKPKITSLKKKLDAIFSKYIRQKYSQEGQVRCYTCGVVKDIKEIQNGHFVSRSILSLRFDERNCRPQCVGCNVFGGGKVSIFGHKLEMEEKGIVAELYKQAQQIVRDYPYQEKIEYYSSKLKENERNA